MKKSGIVLMMTLILITILMGLTALFLGQSTRLFRLGESGFSQTVSMSIVRDFEQQLPVLFSSVRGPEELDIAMRIPFLLESKAGDFTLKASLSSAHDRININRIATADGNVSEPYMELVKRVFVKHPIADPDIFFKLVLDTIDADSAERGIDTEIGIRRPDYKNGMIADARQFAILLERYLELTGDTSILSIPWENYIGYEGEKMDINAVNADALSLILPSIPAERLRMLAQLRTKAYASKEEAITAEPGLASVFDTYFFVYKAEVPYILDCDVQIQENSRKQHVRFQYNLFDKKVRRVELF